MTKEELIKQIEELENKKKALEKGDGKKQFVKYGNEKVYIPKHLKGKFKIYCSKINNLKHELYLIKANEQNQIDNDFIFNRNETDMPITNCRKPHNKEKLKKRLKSIAKYTATTLLAVTFVFGAHCFSETPNYSTYHPHNTVITHQSNSFIDLSTESTISSTSSTQKISTVQETKPEVTKKDNKYITQTNKIANKTKNETKHKHHKTKKIFNTIKLNAKFKLYKNSNIYSNQYDAINNNNHQQPYKSSETKRTIKGISIIYNNNIVSFIPSQSYKKTYEVNGLGNILYLTTKEANKKINELVNKGGKIATVLSQTNGTNSYEGFYQTSNIKVYKK